MTGVLTVSGNEITDAVRVAAAAWPITQQGGQVDGAVVPGGFFIDRAATNLFGRGQCDAVGVAATGRWVTGAAGAGSAAIDPTTAAPYSPQSALLAANGSTDAVLAAVTGTGLALAAGTLVAGSVWFKGAAGQGYKLLLRVPNTDASTSTVSTTNFTATGGWQLLVPTPGAVAAGKTGDSIRIEVDQSAARVESFWMAHAMIEQGQPYVAPYVATSGGVTATNAASRVQAPATLLASAQGWIAARIRMGYASATATANADIFDWRTDTNNRIHLRHNPTTSKWEAVATNAGVETVAQAAASFNQGDTRTIIMAWGSFGVAVSVNGAAFTTTTATLPTPTGTSYDIGSAAAASQINSSLLWYACGTGTLTNTAAAALAALAASNTANTAAPEDVNLAAATAACTAVWNAATTTYQNEAFVLLDNYGLLPHIKIEVDVTSNPTSPTRTWTDITPLVRQLSYQRSGRNQEINRSTAGTLTAICGDQAGAITSLGLRKRQWVRVRARWQGIEYPRWQGILETLPRKWPGDGADQLVELHARDVFKVLALTDLAGQTYPSQRNDQRVTSILATATAAAAPIDTDTDTADAVTTPMPDQTMALDYLLQIEASENGLLIANPDGTVDFQGRHWRFFNADTPVATLGESAGQIPYLDDVEYDDDDSMIANIAGVTPYGASSAVVAVNSASTSANFPTRMDIQLLSSDTILAQSAAEWITRRYGDPSPRVPGVTVELGAAGLAGTSLLTVLLAADNSTRFTWTRQASTPISEDVYIEQIAETVDVAGGSWQWKAQLSPSDDDAGWVLGASRLGVETALVY